MSEFKSAEWQWGMWADYEDKRVFVMSGVDDDGEVQISHTEFMGGFEYAPSAQLVPIED